MSPVSFSFILMNPEHFAGNRDRMAASVSLTEKLAVAFTRKARAPRPPALVPQAARP